MALVGSCFEMMKLPQCNGTHKTRHPCVICSLSSHHAGVPQIRRAAEISQLQHEALSIFGSSGCYACVAGHLSARQEVHKAWTSRLEAEFFNQGDQERSRGLQVSALMDRENRAGITKSQVLPAPPPPSPAPLTWSHNRCSKPSHATLCTSK